MNDAGLVPFGRLFPRQAVAETRVLTVRGSADLPDGGYGLLESYCIDAGRHCRRVMLNVIGRRQQAVLASISYGFDREEEDTGPFLDPLNPRSRHADELLDLVAQILADPDYVARLEAHYYQVKGAMSDPTHPGQQLLRLPAAWDSPRPLGKPASRQPTRPSRKRTRRSR